MNNKQVLTKHAVTDTNLQFMSKGDFLFVHKVCCINVILSAEPAVPFGEVK